MSNKVATFAQKNMSTFILLNVVAVLLIGAVVFGAYKANASTTNKYPYVARGIVKEINSPGTSMRLYIQYATTDMAKGDLLGEQTDFNMHGAVFYKWVNGKKLRVTFSKMAQLNDEVVVKGFARSNGEFNVTEATRNDRSFSVIGKLHNYSNDNTNLQITVESSTYKPSVYVGKDVWMQWGDNAKFYGGNKSNIAINSDEINADDQRVKVVGKLEGNNWQVYSVYNTYKAKK